MKCHKFAHEPKINNLGVFDHTSEALTKKKWNLIFCEGLSIALYKLWHLRNDFSRKPKPDVSWARLLGD